MTVLAVQHSGIGGVGRRHWRRRVMALAERPPGLHQRMQRRGCGAMESRSAQASGQLRYEPIDQKHTESALELVLSRYENERAHVPALPPGAEFRDSLGRAIEVHDCRVAVKKADVDDIPSVADIHTRHFSYYRSSPIFMDKPIGDPSQDFLDWISKPNHHLWIAFADGELLGYIRIEPDGESFVSRHPSVMKITGALRRIHTAWSEESMRESSNTCRRVRDGQ